MKYIIPIIATCLLITAGVVQAECPLDHFIVGVNRDGIIGTDDDNKLFADCRQKYRNSDDDSTWGFWFYPLNSSFFSSYKYRVGEPGFDMFQDLGDNSYADDPNYCLAGSPNVDYSLVIECNDLSPGLRIVESQASAFVITETGQSFNYSDIHDARNNPHMHVSYQGQDNETLYWATWIIRDTLADGSQYEASEPITIVFNQAPLSGDLVVDGVIDTADLEAFGYYWLRANGSLHNDYYERADCNQDGAVTLTDFSMLASNWSSGLNNDPNSNDPNSSDPNTAAAAWF